jgi:hypothetical protein
MKITRKQLGYLIKSVIKESAEEFDSPDHRYFSKALELLKALKKAQVAYAESARSVIEQEKMINKINNDQGLYGMAGTAAMGTGVPQTELEAREAIKEDAADTFDACFDELDEFGSKILDYGKYEDLKADGYSEEDLRVFRGQGWGKKSREVEKTLSNGGFKAFYQIREPYRRYRAGYHHRRNSDAANTVINKLEAFLGDMMVPVDMSGAYGKQSGGWRYPLESSDVSRVPDGLKK